MEGSLMLLFLKGLLYGVGTRGAYPYPVKL